MPTIFTHAVFGIAISELKNETKNLKKFYFFILICTMIPDLDVISFYFGISYTSVFGHRGFTHSILFALVFSFLISLFFEQKIFSKNFFFYLFVFFLVTISHAILDAFTNGGLGVCFYCPFDSKRFFFDFRPILVSPIGKKFFSERGVSVFLSELQWVWIPSIILFFSFKIKKLFFSSK